MKQYIQKIYVILKLLFEELNPLAWSDRNQRWEYDRNQHIWA